MRVAVIGSRGLMVDDLTPYLPQDTTEIISGGAKGIDACAKAYAQVTAFLLQSFCPSMNDTEDMRR